MTAITTQFGSGGTNLSPNGASGAPDLATTLRDIADDLADAAVLQGILADAPTTPSSQATGAGTLDWNVDLSAGFAAVNGVNGEFGAQADYSVVNGATPIVDGNSIVAALVAEETAGTVSLQVVLGTSAVTGSEVPPTDAEITTGVGHSRWAKVAELTINRTGDTTVTQSQSNGARLPTLRTTKA
jgi:hypothetical protein